MSEPVCPFTTEEECASYLASLRWPKGFVCPECTAAGEPYRITSRPRVLECRACGHQASVTAGTVMHRSKLPMLAWLRTVWRMCRSGGISARRVAQELGLRYETAWRLCHKIRAALGQDFDPILTGFVSVGVSFGEVRRPHPKHRFAHRKVGIVAIASTDGSTIDPHVYGEASAVTTLHHMFSGGKGGSRAPGAHAATAIRETLDRTFRQVSRHWLRRYMAECQHRHNRAGPDLRPDVTRTLVQTTWSPWTKVVPRL